MAPTQKGVPLKCILSKKQAKTTAKLTIPWKLMGGKMTFPFKHSPFFRRYVGYVYLPGEGRMPHPNKAFEGHFFGRGFLNPPNSGDHGPNGLAEKRGAVVEKPGGIFRLLFSRIWSILGRFLAALLRLERLILLVVVFLDFFGRNFGTHTRGDDPIGRIFSWESKGTHPMDDEYDAISRAQKTMGNIFHWTSCSKRRAADKTM